MNSCKNLLFLLDLPGAQQVSLYQPQPSLLQQQQALLQQQQLQVNDYVKCTLGP